ncbi:MAG: hypothetical protein L0Y75_00830 [Acidobacteria bacterium]|nr:hypothetical protein [Acidobacteriota bacterium]
MGFQEIVKPLQWEIAVSLYFPQRSVFQTDAIKTITCNAIDEARQSHGFLLFAYVSSLEKLQHEEWKRNHRYSLWQQEKNVFSVFSEAVFMEKVNYIHLNPVRAGLVERAIDYRWSSARYWQRCETDDEPLRVDLDRIEWRRGA